MTGSDIVRPDGNSRRRQTASAPLSVVVIVAVSFVVGACQPTVRVEAPKEPITINLNVNLDAEVRVKLEEQAQDDIAKNEEIF